jgi:hypothetical protein
MAYGLKVKNGSGTVLFSTNTVGQNFIGTQYYAANSVIYINLPSPKELTAFTYYIFPAQAFSPTFIMQYPSVSITKINSTTINLYASGGNMAVYIHIFGR